jgi:hypothetical protein
MIPNVLHDLPFSQNQSLKLAKDPVYWNSDKEDKNPLQSFPPPPPLLWCNSPTQTYTTYFSEVSRSHSIRHTHPVELL